MNNRLCLILLLNVLLPACVSTPSAIRRAPPIDVQLNTVRGAVSQHEGTEVRWGGTIIQVENEAEFTRIQVLHYPLWHYGRPRTNLASQGRFMIQSRDFLDPAVYTKGRLITVVGQVRGQTERLVGKKPVQLPVVEMATHYLWQRSQEYAFPYPSYYFGYNTPFYPYRRYYRPVFWQGRYGRGPYFYCD